MKEALTRGMAYIEPCKTAVMEIEAEPDAGAPATGKVTLDIVSSAAKRFLLGVVQFPPGVEGPPPFSFAPFLSGRRLLTTQTFRHLFRSEVIGSNEGIGVKDLALLFTDVKGLTALYDRMGDVNAFALVRQHFVWGAAIAATLNDRLDCFGPTVNTAARVQNLADADEICISRDAYDADGVKETLAPFAIESRDARRRGLEQSLQAFPVAAREAPRPIA